MRAKYRLNTDGERHFEEKFKTGNRRCRKDGSDLEICI